MDSYADADPGAPVFVLCMGRSGSTLLRFLLDAHPDLACPPETSLPALCGQLAVVWSLIEGAPLAEQRGDTPPEVPAASITGIRRTLDLMLGPYLERRGGRRFCDKSLSSARFADLLLRVYPDARFLCLFRHPMDVIASGLEACPWGLNGYGFDAYIGASPGNAVLAMARYWLDEATAIAKVAERYPQSCYPLRYEDLVSDTEEVAAGIFDFVGVPQSPGISQRCLGSEHERFGPGDYKIWRTAKITSGSVGHGQSIPVGLIPPPILAEINKLAGQLGYVQIDEKWGTTDMPASLLADAIEPATGSDDVAAAAGSLLLAERLTSGLARIDRDEAAARWESCSAEAFMLTGRSQYSGDEVSWYVEFGDAGLALAEDCDPDWSVVGSARAWEAVLRGEVNLASSLRRCDLRYCDAGETDATVADARISLLSVLLGLPSPGSVRAASLMAPAR